jgi:hypothetical protein
MPAALRARLGDEASEGLVQLLDAREYHMTERITASIVEALEPRFSAIEAQLSQCATQGDIDRRFEAMERRFDSIDRRFERIDSRFEKTDDRATAFETRVMTKLDAQFLAIDTKLSRVMTVQIGTITVFASIVGGAFIALLARS